MPFHNPVLLNESIKGLNIKPNGVYVDATFGGGGHSKLILEHLDDGQLFAFDQDQVTQDNILSDNRFKLINTNFRYIKSFLRMEGIEKIDGLLADLGVSSYQFDNADRGFSIRFESELDMRMNTETIITAKEIINNYSEENLSKIFYEYGELRNSRQIAREILHKREVAPIITTIDLINSISHLSPLRKKNQFLARVFQSIRIEVNEEIASLKDMLKSAIELLNKTGRLVVLSYHSIEDRLIKNLFKKGNFEGDVEKDFYGNIIRPFKEINNKIIVASAEEIRSNPRSRSAKLRIAEKI
tara:strand:- start:5 stop:901 length:897 start_codon:yes stop_codon:yes gene_type:complete